MRDVVAFGSVELGSAQVTSEAAPPKNVTSVKKERHTVKGNDAEEPERVGTAFTRGAEGGAHESRRSEHGAKRAGGEFLTPVQTKNAEVRWDAIIGCDAAKDVLWEACIAPGLQPQTCTGLRRPPKGILLFGPPGTGKTMIAKAAACEIDGAFFNVKMSDIANKYMGESERKIAELFTHARTYANAVVFIDEIDGLAVQREDDDTPDTRRIMAELLAQVDGLQSVDGHAGNVVLIGATNHPDVIDEGMLRRFEERVFVGLPDREGRLRMLDMSLRDQSVSTETMHRVSSETNGQSYADLRNLVRYGAMQALREARAATAFKECEEGARPIDTRGDADSRAAAARAPSRAAARSCQLDCDVTDAARVGGPTTRSRARAELRRMLTPCNPTDERAMPMRLADVPKGALVLRKVTDSDVMAALAMTHKTVTDGQAARVKAWAAAYGTR